MQNTKSNFFCSRRFFVFVFVGIYFHFSSARDISTKKLQSQGKLKVSAESCIQAESRLGQLLYVNVDGWGANGRSIHPGYIKMVNDLQIGGVLPHSANSDYKTQKSDFQALQAATELPLMIGVDYLALTTDGRTGAKFGMGFGSGFLHSAGYAPPECLTALSYMEGFLHKASGLNHALGPTIERNRNHGFLERQASAVAPAVERTVNELTNNGIASTMKHFPYTPENYNLHSKSEDTRVPADKVYEMLEIFKRTANKTSFAMSTHLYNSNIDPDDMATFSKKWVDILRKDMGFQGILMTDALFMFKQYGETVRQMSSKWPQDQIKVADMYTIFAARSILSGHDMIFLEGDSASTYKIFDSLMSIACDDKPVSQELRQRIDESYQRISKWKNQNNKSLKQSLDIPESLVSEAIQLRATVKDVSSCNKLIAFQKKTKDLGVFPIEKIIATGAPPNATDPYYRRR